MNDSINNSAISLQSVQYAWAKQDSPFLAIDDLCIASGEKIFLYGASGSGKSTLLNLIAGVVSPRAGSIHVLGQDIARMSNRQRDQFRAQYMGIIFQQFNLIPYLNCVENLQMRVEFLPRDQKQSAVAQIPVLLERLGIANVAQQQANQLSVGQQQRVALARALLGSPRIIIADEPTSALDADLRETFMQLLFELLDEKTALLFVSHDQQLLPRFDRVLNMQDFRATAPDAQSQPEMQS
ncbi:ABC transporter ATP-binding protein [Cellvibrio sp. pealriver]|uniref:ABC transporter ATP-binding protein n=1 Tax=Cellvibrio sp. pealriver TaxID=1622269 RepID=UPI00066FE3B2|nr:ABC transporter ATP-binding protein [Cellvibrio sp. pealriver]